LFPCSEKERTGCVEDMDIQKEDIISVIVTFCLLFTWYVTLVSFNYPLLSLLVLWVGMVVLTIVYYLVYRNKKRDMKIFKMRFIVSALPIYTALAFYVYLLLEGKHVSGVLRLLPIGIIGTMLLLNAGVVYYYTRDT
jgi:hypothetical protein